MYITLQCTKLKDVQHGCWHISVALHRGVAAQVVSQFMQHVGFRLLLLSRQLHCLCDVGKMQAQPEAPFKFNELHVNMCNQLRPAVAVLVQHHGGMQTSWL